MDEELEVLRSYVESQRLHEKSGITEEDKKELIETLNASDEITLANYVKSLKTVNELEDLIVNTLYG